MSPRRPREPLSDADRALWDHVTRDIRPLRGRPARPKPQGTREEAPQTNGAAAAPAPSPARPGPSPPRRPPPVAAPAPLAPIERRTRLRLARGVVEIDARIDLHGSTQREAHDRLVRFLIRAQGHGARIVLVITGKGGAPAAAAHFGHERGVLRRQVPLWLEDEDLRPLVVGFETAHAVHGGEGALYVRLRRRRE